MFTTVFLDLDDTLLDFRAAERAAIETTLRQLDLPRSPAVAQRYSQINQSLWELLERGEITREALRPRRFELLFAELGVTRSSQRAQQIYETAMARQHQLVPGAMELLEALAPKYRLFLVTNGATDIQASRLSLAGLAGYFEKRFVSQRLGVNKPSRAFFDLCFQALPEVDRAGTILLGDSLTSDIQGGINAGIATCWFNPQRLPRRGDIVPDHEIHALAEFPPLLEALNG